MTFLRQIPNEITIKPAPEFSDISYAGDGRLFILNGNLGQLGITTLLQGPGLPTYDNSLIAEIDGQSYSKFYCDYFVSDKLKLQSADIKVTGAHSRDFVAMEVLYLYQQDPEIWVLGKRFVKRYYMSTDFEDQDTPELPYAKTLEAGKYIIRMVYHKHELNNNDIDLRVNYMLHEVTDQ